MKRILFIVSLLKGYETVLDIGTDHGLVLKKALDLRYIQRGIAVDINLKPLENAQRNLKNYPVDFYLSDGFQQIQVDFDLAIICGMGAYTIINILKKSFYPGKYFLLGCQSKIHYLIIWLQKNNFVIIKHYIFFDKINYIFFKVLQK
ncbi:tRNA (adenine(22)-N(1))-methyltransferase TrmK [Candidatus Phytoplasma melaleucae]|uniref:Class I SAM-dependent methyltransferase n=1 Tax=Candidatus Phytoplasma melaleucae TaxID=2982630 RepID=A0ABT9DE25_9MOLU|nr:tRNA (adenine(22)-N(1))-methyltransferase TrmK ['Melaleuca sp.' phytoplasma]MDO8168255.1 class I SAM-dependent methyltransferase ['Melaleuca sp.' phytoplasma]MDV3205297.1 tRNA (adenine(22)-N(1))-methyltransferase TrmK [Weeping tea tree witches'-broom phytoplasma]